MPVRKSNIFINFFNDLLIDHPTPANISYLWNFGSLSGIAFSVQLVTGIFLAMHYVPHIDLAFISVEHIMRDVNYGWLMRYLHANGASFFFIVVYAHMFRALYYGAYAGKNYETWAIGVSIYLLMMATAFLGYVLPWGQMSLWGATVITNFFSVLLFIGVDVVTWLWGGYSVNYATLNRFFSLHFFLPFVLAALIFLHLVSLHESGHTNPIGVKHTSTPKDNMFYVTFFPYFIIKDLLGILIFFFLLLFVVFFHPNLLGHPDNYILANPLSTPAHIVPEWYFLPFYAILRSIPNKAFGVVAMFSAILVLYLVPFLSRSSVTSSAFKPLYQIYFWYFFVTCLILGWIGGKPVEYPYYTLGQFATFFYFLYLVCLLPIFSFLETFYAVSSDVYPKEHKWSLFGLYALPLRSSAL